MIVCGLPGAGKTTVARQLENQTQGFRCNPDEWLSLLGADLFDEAMRSRVEALQWEIAQRLLGHGLTVIVDWGTWARAERDQLRMAAQDIGAETELVYLAAPIEVRWHRIKDRLDRAAFGTVPLAFDTLRSYEALFQAPDEDEFRLFDRASRRE